MRVFALALLLAACAPAAAADLPGVPGALPERPSRGRLAVGAGAALPAGGHWGDADAGFKPSGSCGAALLLKKGERGWLGLEAAAEPRHEYRGDAARTVAMYWVGAYARADLPHGPGAFYGLAGAGLAAWKHSYPEGAGTRRRGAAGAGLTLGAGYELPLASALRGALELRWRHLPDLDGGGLDLGASGTLLVSAVFLVPL